MPSRTSGQRGEDPPARRLVQDGPRDEGHDHDLEVAEHGRQARADVVDRLVPEDQVGGEEDPGDEREALLAGRARAVAPPLPPGERGEQREGVGAAVERGGDRVHGRLADEDGREGDGQRAGEGDERRPAERRRRGDGGRGVTRPRPAPEAGGPERAEPEPPVEPGDVVVGGGEEDQRRAAAARVLHEPAGDGGAGAAAAGRGQRADAHDLRHVAPPAGASRRPRARWRPRRPP